jgi:hypothetical protein
MTKYKFLRLKGNKIKSQSGKEPCYWKIGEWKKEEKISMCSYGFHCSNTILDAFSFVNGEVLAIVKTRGKSEKQSDKECWQEMKIIKAYKWTKKDSVALSIFAAELVLDIYEKQYPDNDRPRKAIEAAKKVLQRDNEKNRSAAASAWSAAESAARSAAWSTVLDKINTWIINHIKELKEL